MRCRKCGSEKIGVMQNKKNPSANDLYCLECGAWQKFATKDEIRLYQNHKIITTIADHIRAMSDEELAEFLAVKLPDDICDWPDLMLEWLRQPQRYVMTENRE